MSFQKELEVLRQDTTLKKLANIKKMKEEAERKWSERSAKEALERKATMEFKEMCDKELLPLFADVQRIWCVYQDSELSSSCDDNDYSIKLQWDPRSQHDPDTGHDSSYYAKVIEIRVIRRRGFDRRYHTQPYPEVHEGEFVLQCVKNWSDEYPIPLSTVVVRNKWLLSDDTVTMWHNKVTLNDHNWKEKVTQTILARIKALEK